MENGKLKIAVSPLAMIYIWDVEGAVPYESLPLGEGGRASARSDEGQIR